MIHLAEPSCRDRPQLRNKAADSRSSSPGRLDVETIPNIAAHLRVPTILGNGALISFAAKGGDVEKVCDFFLDQVRQFPDDGAPLLDLALLQLIQGRKEEAYRTQARALERHQIYRVVGSEGQERTTRRRVLALVAPGDFMNNAQLEFLLDGSDIGLDLLYVVPGRPLPSMIPEHDVVFCAVGESDENIPVLRRLDRLLPAWPRPVLNAPGRVMGLSRDGIAALFAGSKRINAPAVRRVTSSDLRSLSRDEARLGTLLPGADFPILVRSVGSHCGRNLERIDGGPLLAAYLEEAGRGERAFFLAPYVDYRGVDGLFRKYRIAFIVGKPFLCHLAPCEQWKIHYVNAGMAGNASKRAEEAAAMETFDLDFAVRHGAAFTELCERTGLDYFAVDCSELPDGRLLLFEAETAMVIHAMDSPVLYPYKAGQMKKVFAAFCRMIDRACSRPPGIAGK
jgi:hypothetical protein